MILFKRFTASLILLAATATVAAGENWPQWRGPGSQGISSEASLPTEWSSVKNIVWKTELPAGHSSPIVWGNRIFLTGATAERQDVMCFERSSGKPLWRTAVTAPRGDVTPDDITIIPETGYAAPTPATDVTPGNPVRVRRRATR